ncbi:hypothetical protein [Halobacillus sp. A5]|uniref:hypothetical protein n=1 Tax=Halobacillus sp. A5 TaxID=2880263 RepID=UPI0020A669B8|nr:hypothetical protein [Halobacillus sp. A5]MCP3029089.1 hypothetical protein [Halobacillus sp. A5]
MKSDPIQMQQKLIYFKSELDKYKEKVKDYQDNYHYSQLEALKKENAYLLEQNEEFSVQLNAARGELDRRLKGHDREINSYKENKEKLINEKTAVQHKNSELFQQQQKLLSELKTLKEELSTNRSRLSQQQNDMAMLQASYVNAQKELEEKNKELSTERIAKTNAVDKLKTLENNWIEDKAYFEENMEALTLENNTLQTKVEQLEEQLKQAVAVPEESEELIEDQDLQFLAQLETQVKDLLGFSSEFEEDEDSKVIFMRVLENKLSELSNEIDDIESKMIEEENKKS